MGKLRKLGKKIGRGIKKIGKRLKKGLGSIAKAFGKLGFVGSLALSFLLPGIGSAIGGWLQGVVQTGGFGSNIANAALKIADGVSKAGNFVKDCVGKVFNRVTDAIEYGMNAVSKPFMQKGVGVRGAGSAFRDWASNATGGFIDRSTVGLTDASGNPLTKDAISAMSPKELEIAQNQAEFDRTVARLDTREDLLGKPVYGPSREVPIPVTDAAGNSVELINQPTMTVDGDVIGMEYEKMPTFDPGSKPVEVTFNKDTLMPNPAPEGINNPTMVFDEASQKYNWYDGDKYKAGLEALGNPSTIDVVNTNYIEGGPLGPPAPPVEPKPSIFDKDTTYDSFKARVKASREFDTYKRVQPIAMMGMEIQAQEDMEEAQAEMLRKEQAAYFASIGQDTLGGNRGSMINETNVDFGMPMNQDTQFRVMNLYGGILGA